MSNDWGKPFTPEEVAKINNDGWGKPVDLTPAKLTDTPEELAAKGWVQTAHDEWEKIAPDTSPFAGSKVTMKRIDADFDMLIVDETHFEPPTLADWGSEPAFVGGTMTGRKDWSIPDINGDAWPTHPDQLSPMTVGPEEWGDNPTCYAWHPESGCGIIFSDRDALNEALEVEPLLVEMTKEEYDEATKVRAADWPKPEGVRLTDGSYERGDGSIYWPTPEPVKPQSELTRALNTIMAPGFGEPEKFNPAKDSEATAAQMAAVFAAKGTPEQQREALEWAQGADVKTAPVETYSEADGPWYVVYFGPVLYTVLAGPYETEEAAAGRLDIVWGQFEHDAAYDFTFPVRERSGLRAATVRTVYNLKGAYGKQ